MPVGLALGRAVAPRRDDGLSARGFNGFDQGVTVVSLVGHDSSGRNRRHQCGTLRYVGRLTARQDQTQRVTQGVDTGVDLGGQPAPRTAGYPPLAHLCPLASPEALVDAVDISPDALAVARRNVADYALESRLDLIESDAFTGLAGRRYDVIISNPPYVNAESMNTLPHEYRQEPELALASGEDGLDFTRIILAQAAAHLNPGGLLVFEIGHNRDALEAAYPDTPFTWLDTEAGDRYVFMLRREELPDAA